IGGSVSPAISCGVRTHRWRIAGASASGRAEAIGDGGAGLTEALGAVAPGPAVVHAASSRVTITPGARRLARRFVVTSWTPRAGLDAAVSRRRQSSGR